MAPGELCPVTSSVIFGHLSSGQSVNRQLTSVSPKATVVGQSLPGPFPAHALCPIEG